MSTEPDFFAEPGSHHHTPHERTFTNVDGSKVLIGTGQSGALAVGVDTGQNVEFLHLPKDTAPALALAILEAAGWPGDYPGGVSKQIVADLRRVVEITVQKAKEAADREALEHEAEALYLAGCETLAASAAGHTTIAWDDLSGRTQDAHLSVARKARELHGVTK